jgi:cytochrome b subunit of formate dehydrogenase
MASAASPETPRTSPRFFLRFDLHQRLQHGIMALSFITLMVTGWPLRMAGIGSSQAVVDFFGSLEACGMVHRIAAIAMSVSVVHHLAWVFVRWRRGTLSFEIVPRLQDLRDLVQNLRFYVGLRPDPPRFGRWTYFEKFDYWAVFWGVAIMAGSGVVLWFPELFASFLPAWSVTIAHVAHSDEALLAGLAIFIWHFYNVHMRRHFFPMSWVWLTGKLSDEQMRHEHPLEYERLVREPEPPEPEPEPEPDPEPDPKPEREAPSDDADA